MRDILEIKLLTDSAKLPTYGSSDAAGLDLYADEILTLGTGSQVMVRTGIAVAIPRGHVGFIWPRSGLANKKRIDTRAGVIDSDYRGELKVLLVNDGGMAFPINRGDRIAQLVIQKYSGDMPLMCVNEFSAHSERGANGFGSTGK
jgi:deoxyuridine 5'-triphosphate nucleotidohydrolase